MTLDHRAVTVAAIRAQRCPNRKCARAAGHLWTQVAEGGLGSGLRPEISGAGAESPGLVRRVPHKREARVIGNVEPLVTVDDHRVGQLYSLDQVACFR